MLGQNTSRTRTLEDNLLAMNNATLILEFLADAPNLAGSKVTELPTDSQVTAMNIPHASMVFGGNDDPSPGLGLHVAQRYAQSDEISGSDRT